MNRMKIWLAAAAFCLLSLPVLPSVELARPGEIVINETASTGDYDFIELYNTADEDREFGSGWELADRLESRLDTDPRLVIPVGTVIPARGHFLIAPYKTSGFLASVPEEIPDSVPAVRSFAIGSKDEISLYYQDELQDFITWNSDVNTIGRIPDGAEQFSTLLLPTPGEPNQEEPRYRGSPIMLINEVCSRGLDFIELINVSGSAYTFRNGEWLLEDSQKADKFVIPEGTRIAAGGLLVLYPDVLRLPFSASRNSLASTTGSRFGFGNSDSVYLRYRGAVADSYTWEDHVTSAGRLPDGSSTWIPDLIMTPGKPNR